ncbi:hypothetical protein H2248_012546 [Termitomyces sp. 'cryptogamus']|nr:hypothetical protein H2248_012546 [Termitomyces sp. 'cryptogamus']
MFGVTCSDLIKRRTPSGQFNYKMLATACFLFMFSTIHIGIDIHRLVDGFVKHRDTVNGPVIYFGDLGSFTWFFRNLIYALQTLLGDGIVIYRCYVVWSTIWVVILPITLWFTTLITGSAVLWFFAHARTSENNSDIFNANLSHWISAFFASTLAANAVATAFLAFRHWTLDRAVSGLRTTKGNISDLARVVVDSGTIYSSFLVIIIGFYALKSNVQTIIMDITMPIISICFYLIITRLSRRQESVKSFGGDLSRGNFPSSPGSGHRGGIHMRNLKVHLRTDVQVEDDYSKISNGHVFQQEQDP